jgi:hypothetical protein
MSRSPKNRGPATTPYRSIASQMTPAHEVAVRECADAELRGDAATALERHRSVPMFARSTHGDRLELLADLGEQAPSWLLSRWLTVQAQRPMWTGTDPLTPSRALQRAAQMLYPHGVPFEKIGCEHVEQVVPYIAARDWVVRQLTVYEYGGLRRVVERFAAPELLERAGQVGEWCAAPMGAYRLEGHGDAGVLRVADPRSGEAIEVLDLGLLEQLQPGDHVLCRVVPIAEGPGRMFEWRPLPIDDEVARAVARDPDRWLRIIEGRTYWRRLPEAFSHQSETALTADLPIHAWTSLIGLGMEGELDEPPERLVGGALAEALRLAAAGPGAVAARRHVIGELLLEPALDRRRLAPFATVEQLPAWQLLASTIAGPALRRCEEMVLWSGIGDLAS